jgi:histidyl-tRNA synthetase
MSKTIQPPRGTHDLIGDDMRRFRHIVDTARRVSELYNFQEMQTPIFEFSEVFHRSLGDTSDVVSKETYTFPDRGGESLTLRPEFTAAIVRAFISNGFTQQLPFKAFYTGPAFRYERPQEGRQRQFHQVGVECLGANEPWQDAEVILCAYDFLHRVLDAKDGLQLKHIQSNMLDVLSLEINTIGDVESRNTYRDRLVAYFEKYKNDLSEESRIRLEKNPLRILDSKQAEDKEIVSDAPLFKDSLTIESQHWFDSVCMYLDALNIPFKESPRLVRGLDYYTHTVFEFTTDKLGSQGTVLAGGRYNGLVKQMGGDDIVGIGWAAGVERLMLLYKSLYTNFLGFKTTMLVVLNPTIESVMLAVNLSYSIRRCGVNVEIIPHQNENKAYKKALAKGATHFIPLTQTNSEKASITIKEIQFSAKEEIALTEEDIARYFHWTSNIWYSQKNKLLT